jgi:hypothetical protein
MLHVLYSQGKPLIPSRQEAERGPELNWTLVRRKVLPLPGMEPQLSSLYPILILTELSQLHFRVVF